MVARSHQIVSRTRNSPLDFSLIEQFELDAGEDVSAQIIIDERIWHPYTIDVENGALVFLDMPPDIDLSQEAFVFPRQFEEASRALLVPYRELMALSAQVTLPENITFIFSIGRCGSTLLHQIFNQIEGVNSYSEPDTSTILSLFWQEKAMPDSLVADIVEATTKLQIHALTKDSNQVVFKFRSQVNALMPFYLERFPQAKTIFMYRNPLTWARSMFRFLMTFFDDDTMTMDEINLRTRAYPAEIQAQIANYLDMSKKRFYRIEQIALILIFQLEIYLQYAGTHKLFALHYEDMLADPQTVMRSLLNFCDIPQSELAKALQGFERDSQAGTEIAQNFESQELDTEGERLFLDVLNKHPQLGDKDFRL